MNRYDLQDRVAVVTGGAQGLGLAVVTRLVESGARVVAWDLDAQRLEAATAALSCVGEIVDVTDENSVGAAAEVAWSRYGRIDVLVNSAGVAGPNAPLHDYALEAWRRVMEVNVEGTFLCCRAVLPLMRESGYGRIVNIASVAGKEGNPGASAYSASKAAVIALTKSLGKEHAVQDIAVNCVTPAAARTRIFDQMSREHIDFMLSKIPRGRFMKVEEAASLISWLASEECSFSTGAVFDLSGGRATY